MLCYFILFYFILFYFILFYFILFYFILFYFILFYCVVLYFIFFIYLFIYLFILLSFICIILWSFLYSNLETPRKTSCFVCKTNAIARHLPVCILYCCPLPSPLSPLPSPSLFLPTPFFPSLFFSLFLDRSQHISLKYDLRIEVAASSNDYIHFPRSLPGPRVIFTFKYLFSLNIGNKMKVKMTLMRYVGQIWPRNLISSAILRCCHCLTLGMQHTHTHHTFLIRRTSVNQNTEYLKYIKNKEIEGRCYKGQKVHDK